MEKMMHGKEIARQIIYDIFLVSFFAYLGIFFVEGFKKGFVVNVVNPNYLLAICMIAGLGSLTFSPSKENHSFVQRAVLCFFAAGVVSFGIYRVIADKQQYAWLFALAAGITIFLTSYLTLRESNENTKH